MVKTSNGIGDHRNDFLEFRMVYAMIYTAIIRMLQRYTISKVVETSHLMKMLLLRFTSERTGWSFDIQSTLIV